MANLTQTELAELVELHRKWLCAEMGGRRADLRDVDLTDANLRGANLRDANLTGADLGGVEIPIVPDIDAAIMVAIGPDVATLDMASWHGCGTTHCRAGWAITLAGDAGKSLETKIGSAAAGALIYAVSRPGKPVPDFYTSNEAALADIKACANETA